MVESNLIKMDIFHYTVYMCVFKKIRHTDSVGYLMGHISIMTHPHTGVS